MFILPTLFVGSVLRTTYSFYGFPYDHYGIFDGYNNVIHFSEGEIIRTSLRYFTKDSIKPNKNIIEVMGFTAEKANLPYISQKRAQEMLERSEEYCLFYNNCEHFALYCKISLPYSTQSGTYSDELMKKNEISSYFSLYSSEIEKKPNRAKEKLGYSTRNEKKEEEIGMSILKEIDISRPYHNLGESGQTYYVVDFSVEVDNKNNFINKLKDMLSKYDVNLDAELQFSGINNIKISDFSFSTYDLQRFVRGFNSFLKIETNSYSCSLDGGIFG